MSFSAFRVELEFPVESDSPGSTTTSLWMTGTATSVDLLESSNKQVHKSGSLCRGTLQQFSQIVEVKSARVTDHEIAEAAVTPGFHVER